MFAGIQKAVYPGLAGFIISLVGQMLTGEGGPTDEQIGEFVGTISLTVGEIITSTLTGVLTALVAYIRKNVNVNKIVMSFVDSQGNVQDASGKIIGQVSSGDTKLRSPMWVGAMLVGLMALVGCQAASDLSMGRFSRADQVCTALGIAMDERHEADIQKFLAIAREHAIQCMMSPDGSMEAIPAESAAEPVVVLEQDA
jgi:hypothetical protein